jgi:hypothetical protein
MGPAPRAPDGALVATGLGWALPANNPILSAAQAGAAFVAGKISDSNIHGGLAKAVGDADKLLKESVLPAAGASFSLAKKKISKVNMDDVVANAVSLSQAAMAGSVVAAEAAVSVAKDHISNIDVQAGIAGAVGKSQEVMAGVGPAAGKVRPSPARQLTK